VGQEEALEVVARQLLTQTTLLLADTHLVVMVELLVATLLAAQVVVDRLEGAEQAVSVGAKVQRRTVLDTGVAAVEDAVTTLAVAEHQAS
jgi:hypothetical protein